MTENQPSLANFPIQKCWTVIESVHEGHPMIVRFNIGAKPYREHPELPFRFGVAVPLLRPNQNGLPDQEEAAVLRSMEDALCGALQPKALGFLVMVITSGGVREFVFYIRGGEYAAAAIGAAARVAAGHEVQRYLKEDREWKAYGQYSPEEQPAK